MKPMLVHRKQNVRFLGRADRLTIRSLKLFYSLVIITVSISAIYGAAAVPETIDKELILTQKEKLVLDKFKAAVYQNITQPFMKQDLFLLRWIRSKDLDLNRSIKDMEKFFTFYRENKLEHILEEDWSDIEEDYPFKIIYDRQGRPVAYMPVGNWKIRAGIVQGRRERLKRYMYRLTLIGTEELIQRSGTYPNVTQVGILMNLEGFNAAQHACSMCIPTYLNMLDFYERFFPGITHEVNVVNAPQTYAVLLQTLRPALSKHTRDTLHIFGPNKRQWMPYVVSKIDPKYLKDLE